MGTSCTKVENENNQKESRRQSQALNRNHTDSYYKDTLTNSVLKKKEENSQIGFQNSNITNTTQLGNQQNNNQNSQYSNGNSNTFLSNNNNNQQQQQLQQQEIQQQQQQCNLDDFQFCKVIGRGGFGKVLLVYHKKTDRFFAMKSIIKEKLEQQDSQYHLQERQILTHINYPFIIKLHYAFQSEYRFYMVMDFVQGGELNEHLKKYMVFEERVAKFFIAQIILAIKHLHSRGILYRDLKPSNILIDSEGNVKLVDFGLSKVNFLIGQKANTMCGTFEYIAPEIFEQKEYSYTVDWYSMGIVFYQMLMGKTPFVNQKVKQMFHDRKTKELVIPEKFDPATIDFIQKLLKNDPEERLGHNGVEEIQNHQIFKDVRWQEVENKQIDSPFKPRLNGNTDLRHFDQENVEDCKSKETPSKKIGHYNNFSFDEDIDKIEDQRRKSQSFFNENISPSLLKEKNVQLGISEFLQKEDKQSLENIENYFD